MFKVLVVDDDEEILKMMRIALEMKNYEVTTYSFVSLPLNIKEFQLLSFLLAQKIQRKI